MQILSVQDAVFPLIGVVYLCGAAFVYRTLVAHRYLSRGVRAFLFVLSIFWVLTVVIVVLDAYLNQDKAGA